MLVFGNYSTSQLQLFNMAYKVKRTFKNIFAVIRWIIIIIFQTTTSK